MSNQYNVLDFSSISKVSKSDDSMNRKGRINTDYSNLLKNQANEFSSPSTIKLLKDKNGEIVKDKDFLSEFYKAEDQFKLEKGEVDSIRSGIQFKKVKLEKKSLFENNKENNIDNNLNRSFSSLDKKKSGKSRLGIINSKITASSSHILPKINKKENENKYILSTNKNLITIDDARERRKKSMLLKRFSTMSTNKKRGSEINSNMIQKFVKESEKETQYGKNMKYLKWLDVLLSCLVIANIVASLIDNEIYITEANEFVRNKMSEKNITIPDAGIFEYMSTREITVKENFFRYMNCIVVGCILFCIVAHYYLKVRILRADQKLSEHEGLWKSGYTKSMMIEIFFGIWVYPPYSNHVIYGDMLGQPYAYNINSLICIMVTFKSYIILRVYTYFSRWTSDTAKSLCLKHNVIPGIRFAMKAELKRRPYTMLLFGGACLVVIFSFSIRTFEYYVVDPGSDSLNNKLQLLFNSIWLTLMTMLTVGYGDMYPRSHWGRLIGVVSCVIGLLLVSLIVVSLAIISEFKNEERKAYSILKKINADTNATNKALDVILTFLKLRKMLIQSKKFKLSERFIIITKLKKFITYFKNDYKIANSHSLPIDEILKTMENKLKEDIVTLGGSIKKIVSVDKTFNSINSEQRKYVEMMEVISQRQEKISQYLVELNNENLKKNLLEYKKFMKKKTKYRKFTHDFRTSKILKESSTKDEIKRSNTIAVKQENLEDSAYCYINSNIKNPEVTMRTDNKYKTEIPNILNMQVVNLIKMKTDNSNQNEG